MVLARSHPQASCADMPSTRRPHLTQAGYYVAEMLVVAARGRRLLVGEGTGVIDEIRASLTRHLRGYEVRSLAKLGEGSGNVVYEVNGELIVRASKETDPASRSESTQREARLLAVVAELSTLPVPEPVFADIEAGVFAYVKLPGLPLIDHPVAQPSRLAAPLGDFLNHLHQVPLEKVEELVVRDTYPPLAWRQDAERTTGRSWSTYPRRLAAWSRISSAARRQQNPVQRRSATTTSGQSTCWLPSRRTP